MQTFLVLGPTAILTESELKTSLQTSRPIIIQKGANRLDGSMCPRPADDPRTSFRSVLQEIIDCETRVGKESLQDVTIFHKQTVSFIFFASIFVARPHSYCLYSFSDLCSHHHLWPFLDHRTDAEDVHALPRPCACPCSLHRRHVSGAPYAPQQPSDRLLASCYRGAVSKPPSAAVPVYQSRQLVQVSHLERGEDGRQFHNELDGSSTVFDGALWHKAIFLGAPDAEKYSLVPEVGSKNCQAGRQSEVWI